MRAHFSVRGRLFAAVLLAGAPGIVFGALEAERIYTLAATQQRVVRSDDAMRASVRIEDWLFSGQDGVKALAARPDMRVVGPDCTQNVARVIANQTRFYGYLRLDARGRVICASEQGAVGADLGRSDWFTALAGGAEDITTGLVATPLGAERVVLAAAPMRKGAAFDGAVAIAMAPRPFLARLKDQIDHTGAVVIYDRAGEYFGSAVRDVPEEAARAAAQAVAGEGARRSTTGGLLAERIDRGEANFRVVAVTPARNAQQVGWRAALILLAPVLVAALSTVAVWLAMNRWVLRWFARLQNAAQDFAVGRYAPTPMAGAPMEIATLAGAFDTAVNQARARERDLAAALAVNTGLTRELHHRVKNNLQVLASLISRQQRRSDEPVVRAALSEARARMAPIALVYRFINPPEERTSIDMNPYLTELAQQLHLALQGEARGVTLTTSIEHGDASIDDAANFGLVVAEVFITGYAGAGGLGGATATLRWTCGPGQGCELSVGVITASGAAHERKLDHEMLKEIARQLGAEMRTEPNGAITLATPPKAHASEPG